MEGAYLPGNIRQRMQELMKEHKITQAQLATRIGSTESAISRFVSGKTDKISTEHLLRIAKVFEVSTDFLLGEVNTPDRTNFDIEELGLSVQAARNLYTGKANAEIVNRLLESPRFAEVTYMIEQYFDDTLAAGFAGQNQMLTTLSAMLRRNNKTDAAVQAARTVNRQKVPVYQADLTMIQNTFMAALREVKKEIGNDFTAAQSLTKGITQQMFTELTKGADVHTPTITLDMIHWLKEKGIVMIEQPMPKEQLDDIAWITQQSPLPIFADESLQRLGDVAALKGAFTGINIKLMKCTGMREGWKMVTLARALGMKVMVGCMTETSCACSAAAQFSPAVDFADLDGNLLIANDRFKGMEVVKGKITLPDLPGIGVVKL